MPLTFDTDDKNLVAVLNKIGDKENDNAGAHDKAILALAGAALTLSLTFTKDVVPPASAIDRWALLAAWTGLVVTIAINIGGFILSLMNARAQIKMAYIVWREKKQTVESFIERVHRDEWMLYRLNVGQGTAFLASMGLLAFYVGANFHTTPTADPWVAWAAKWASGN
jgi:hypothetical protein